MKFYIDFKTWFFIPTISIDTFLWVQVRVNFLCFGLYWNATK